MNAQDVDPKQNLENNHETWLDRTLRKMRWTYTKWEKMAAINENDSIPVSIVKIGIRVMGILFFLAISPFLIIGLLFGLFAAM